MADAAGLNPAAARHGGSNPSSGTISLVDRDDYLAMARGIRRAHDACMELLIGLAMTLGYAIVVGGFLVLIAGLTGGLGPDGADEGLHRRDR